MVSTEGTSKYLSEIDLKKQKQKQKTCALTDTDMESISIFSDPHNWSTASQSFLDQTRHSACCCIA